MAHKKGQGSSRNGRESHSKRLGVKLFGGQFAQSGNIIVRQRGTQFHPGEGVGLGKDHTIFAMRDGIIQFTTKKNNRKYISVLPIEEEVVTAAPKKETKKAAVVKDTPAVTESKETTKETAKAEVSSEVTFSSASAEAFAKENDVDATKITPTGKGGKITKKDIQEYLKS